MNTPDRRPDDDAAVKAALADMHRISRSADVAAAKGRSELPRLVEVALGHSGQSDVVVRWLASIYNGSEAPSVELDEIRRLDWDLRELLLAVILGCNQGDFSDKEIREAFAAAGGQPAVDRLHSITGNASQVAALSTLITFARDNRKNSSGTAVLLLLRSVVDKSVGADLNILGYLDVEIRTAAVSVLDALHGRNRGKLSGDDVRAALVDANLLA